MNRPLSPLARFSITLAAILSVTAIALATGTAYLIDRYVEDETARFTQSSVASHFGTVFDEDVFDRPLSDADRESLETIVSFHFSIYGVVATQFFLPNGTIVFSYDEDEVGRRVSLTESAGLRQALAGAPHSERTTIVADLRYAKPGGSGEYAGSHEHGSVESKPQIATVDALETWVPVERGGAIIGAAVVWRDIAPVQAALRDIQLSSASIIALAAALLWLLLRGVYARSSQQIVRQANALSAAVTEIETTYDRTLQALSNALDVRDSETEGHARRVVEYMELIAHELRIPVEDMAVLRRGARLHDIGKVGVPDRILRKPAALSESEWATMRRHPDLGARIIGGIPFLEQVAAIVRHHHERWDGRGYPDGLAGDAIPLGARVFTVADSFDAMTSDRPYRSAMTVDDACREIARGSGTQFDPHVVDAFLAIPVERLRRIQDSAPHADRLAVAIG